MIAYIKGKVLRNKDNKTIILGNSIGWNINTGSKIFLEGQEVELFIYTHMTDKDITLWGFNEELDLSVFEQLISVSGIGPKTAYTILDKIGTVEVIKTIITEDASLMKVPGVGEKSVKKLILDLKSKFDKMFTDIKFEGVKYTSKISNQLIDDGVEALKQLGYREFEIKELLKNNDLPEFRSTQDFIKYALTRL